MSLVKGDHFQGIKGKVRVEETSRIFSSEIYKRVVLETDVMRLRI